MHFVIIGGDGVQLLGGIYTPHPPCFGTADPVGQIFRVFSKFQTPGADVVPRPNMGTENWNFL